MEEISCDLCNSVSYSPFLKRTDRFSGESFQYVTCNNCGLIFLNPRPTQTDIYQYYPENYECFTPVSDYTVSENLRWANTYKYHLELILDFAQPNGQLLDVGCGTGDFMSYARANGWSVFGVEPVESAARISQTLHKLDVKIGHFEPYSFPSEYFDIVTMWDVMEHLPSPKTALEIVYKLLKPRGFLFCSIPNLNSFDKVLFGSRWIGWDAPRHLFLFSNFNIANLANLTNFTILDNKCISGAKGTFKLSLTEILNNDQRNLAKYLTPIISAIFWPYRKISYFLNRAPIITYVLQKYP